MTLPTNHEVAAALAVARRVDLIGNDAATLARGLQHAATQGHWPYDDLDRGRLLLTRAGLLVVDGTTVVASEALRSVAGMPDHEALSLLYELIVAAVSTTRHSAPREEVGTTAEALVVDECRSQLARLGRSDLENDVQRVSLVSDMLGYDVAAPLIGGAARMLEVKGSTRFGGGIFEFYLSRNEFQVGTRNPGQWWLVACCVDATEATVIGHCSAAAMSPFLPRDERGRWTEALVRMPSHLLAKGLPSALA